MTETVDNTISKRGRSKSNDGDAPVLVEVIEKIGFGLAQIRAGLIGGGVFFADGAEILLIASVTDAVAKTWDLSASERGLVVTIVFVGILSGNLGAGPISDSFGRRPLIIISFLGIFVFSICSSLTMGLAGLAIVRFFVGVSFGIGQPAWTTLGAEVTPAKWRIGMQAISQSFFIGGEIFSCLLLLADDPTMKNLNWRRLLQLGSIPSVLFGLAALFFLNESPAFLAFRGKYIQAMDVLESMQHDNSHCGGRVATGEPPEFRMTKRKSELTSSERRASRRLSVNTSYKAAWKDLKKQMGVVFGRQLLLSTIIVSYCCFVLNFLYYGGMYAFPQVLASDQVGGTSGAAMELLIGALWELPGYALGIVCGIYMLRKRNIKLYLFCSSISIVLFVIGLTNKFQGHAVLMIIGYYGIKCFVNVGFVVVYQYSIEIYPTSARTTGSALAIGSGRLAGIISPMVFEGIHKKTGEYGIFFYILLGLAVFNFLIVDFLKYETQGQLLKDEIEDSDEEEEATRANPEAGEAKPLLKSDDETTILLPHPLQHV